MKTKKILSIISIAGITFLVGACSETISNVEDLIAPVNEEKSIALEQVSSDSCTFSGVLSEIEIEGIMAMREEEKLARDVYRFFYEKYNFIIFNNISKSENVHTNAILRIINAYGLEDPALEGDGEFTNSIFDELYSTLTKQGSESLTAALKVGAFIEEFDINDLNGLLNTTENTDIIRVYNNLLRGSEFHLKAFTNVLVRQGEIYSPTIITEEEYLEIVGEPVVSVQPNTGTGVCDGTGPNS